MGGNRTTIAARAAQAQRRAAAAVRPQGPDRHSVCVAQRYPVGDAATGVGLRERHDLLAAAASLAKGRRVAPAAPGAARPAGPSRPNRLEPRFAGRRHGASPRGGEKTGPDPTNRGKSGTKRHLVVDRNGLPLSVTISAANVHDNQMLEVAIDLIEPIRRPRGRPRQRPHKLHADKAYDSRALRAAPRSRASTPRIARRGIESSQRLGRYRWVAERTLSWLNRFRRLKVRYERSDDVHLAFLQLGCALICWRAVQRFC